MMVALILMAARKATAHEEWLMSYVKIMPPASVISRAPLTTRLKGPFSDARLLFFIPPLFAADLFDS